MVLGVSCFLTRIRNKPEDSEKGRTYIRKRFKAVGEGERSTTTDGNPSHDSSLTALKFKVEIYRDQSGDGLWLAEKTQLKKPLKSRAGTYKYYNKKQPGWKSVYRYLCLSLSSRDDLFISVYLKQLTPLIFCFSLFDDYKWRVVANKLMCQRTNRRCFCVFLAFSHSEVYCGVLNLRNSATPIDY